MANVSRDQSDPPGGESGVGRQTSHPGISSSAAKKQERVTSRAAFVWAFASSGLHRRGPRGGGVGGDSGQAPVWFSPSFTVSPF